MNDDTNDKNIIFTDIDLDKLMDLRIDFAFKLFFTIGDASRLISLLNAIFANKSIPRVVKSLKLLDPALARRSKKDKLSTLDLLAELDDNTNVAIEMHLYGFDEFKIKSVRSLARIFSEDMESGDQYSEQNAAIHISFIGGTIKDYKNKPIEKMHSLFHMMERDTHEILLTDLEMHYINMNAFVQELTKNINHNKPLDTLSKWLILITQKKIPDKSILEVISQEEEFYMAIQALSILSEDKYTRQAYQRRLDEVHSHAMLTQKIIDQSAMIADKDAENERLRLQIAELNAKLKRS